VKQIVEALERFGFADDSVVIVTSDHGESLGEHQTFFHGTTLYDEQVRVPLLFRVGNRLQPLRDRLERRRAIVAGQVDFVPTMLHMLSGRAPSAEPFDGVSLLTDRRKPYEMLLYRGVGEKAAFVKDGRKYIFDLQGQRAEEYALTEDPGERRNLWTGDERSILQFTDTLVKRGVLARRAP
jgi:arylsulfatase A-like enzyme